MNEPQLIVPRCPRCGVPLLNGDKVLHCQCEDCPHWPDHNEPLFQKLKADAEK